MGSCLIRAVVSCTASPPTRCGASSRSTGRCSSRPAPSRSSPTGWSGRSSPCRDPRRTAPLVLDPRDSCARQLALLALAAVAHHGQLGRLHLRRQHRPRGRGRARLLHQPAGQRPVRRAAPPERLRPWQWVAVGLGALAVVVLALDYGRLPWIALVLASSFGTYGLVKKIAQVGAAESLTIETLVLLLPALGYLLVSAGAGHRRPSGTQVSATRCCWSGRA